MSQIYTTHFAVKGPYSQRDGMTDERSMNNLTHLQVKLTIENTSIGIKVGISNALFCNSVYFKLVPIMKLY